MQNVNGSAPTSNGHRSSRWLVSASIGALVLTATTTLNAKPGTHPIAVSTFDTRASTVVFSGYGGLMEEGGFHTASYHANFVNTRGTLSSQFGLHYLNLTQDSETMHGIAGSAVGVFSWPIGQRRENAVPKFAISWFLGGAPTALIRGELNFMTAPLVTGIGLPWSPSQNLSLIPFFEVSPSFNLDSSFNPEALETALVDRAGTVVNDCVIAVENTIRAGGDIDVANPDTLPPECEISSTEARESAQAIFQESVDVDMSAAVGARAGLAIEWHLGSRVDLRAVAAGSTIGPALGGDPVLSIGGGFVFRWDRIVPAILPPESQLP